MTNRTRWLLPPSCRENQLIHFALNENGPKKCIYSLLLAEDKNYCVRKYEPEHKVEFAWSGIETCTTGIRVSDETCLNTDLLQQKLSIAN